MLRQNSSNINWQFLLLGLFYIIMQCDARAVNVSNTWTMPQEGLNVFYRFFRDRISWFEADAVCQFHHANLVTVDNSFQFDATRDLLRELDVNDIVWIGLMRPQSSDRFMWSNSRPLVADTGYWAESLPLMDAPLCAVIDPIRDYRWHALRCGGPETASFLCEMPVPSWADACNLKDMPNLTLQYMADTASIELIRNCQEEGLLRTMCRGKQDRERALQDLICPRERLEAQRINDITNSHFKSLQIINSIPSDNNENNDIELLPMEVNYGPQYPEEVQTEKNTVQRLIEQFNVDELMQADEPSNMETVSSFYKIPGLIPKPVKKSAKKVLEYPKKDNAKQKGITVVALQKDKKHLPLEMDEMMMGDQAQGEPEMTEQLLNDEVSNEIMEPLPHIKKTNMYKEDMGKMEKEAIAMKESMQKSKEMEIKKMMMMTTTTTTEPATTTAEITTTKSTTTTTTTEIPTTTNVISTTQKSEDIPRLTEEHIHRHPHDYNIDFESGHLTTTTVPATIGHPMHPQQPRSNVITDETQHPHIKESTDNSHFIPPMLMVKSHYVPSTYKHGHNEHHHLEHLETTTEEQAETTIKHDQNQTTIMAMTTTPKVLDLEQTTLKDLETTQKQQQIATQTTSSRQETESATTTTDSATEQNSGSSVSIKPIITAKQLQTEEAEQKDEQEQRKNSKYLNFEEISTTMTTTTLQPSSFASSSSPLPTKGMNEGTTLQTTTVEKDKNNSNDNVAADDDDNVDETQELKPHTTDTETDTDTTETTKLVEVTTEKFVKPTEKLYDLVSENLQTETAQQTATKKAVHTVAMDVKQQQHKQQQKTEEHDEQQQNMVTTEKTEVKAEEVAAQQTQTAATATDVQYKQTQISVEMNNKQQEHKVEEEEKENEEEHVQKTEEDNKETIKTTTDMLVSTTNLIPTTTSSIGSSSSTTTTTTVKPITSTTKQHEVDIKSTTISSTTTTASTTTTTTTPAPPSVTTLAPSTTTASITTTTLPPETTHNFLKVTTELPYKPNRRRSLTKPESVSYMKKILG